MLCLTSTTLFSIHIDNAINKWKSQFTLIIKNIKVQVLNAVLELLTEREFELKREIHLLSLV